MHSAVLKESDRMNKPKINRLEIILFRNGKYIKESER
jgi:hypothetical protein